MLALHWTSPDDLFRVSTSAAPSPSILWWKMNGDEDDVIRNAKNKIFPLMHWILLRVDENNELTMSFHMVESIYGVMHAQTGISDTETGTRFMCVRVCESECICMWVRVPGRNVGCNENKIIAMTFRATVDAGWGVCVCAHLAPGTCS